MAGAAGHRLTLDHISHAFAGVPAIRDIAMDIAPGAFAALLGPSGCGKTTLLRIISGFVRQDAGRVLIDGAPIDAQPPNRRQVGIVFQSYALFPHLTVAQNVAYGLEVRGTPRAERRERVTEMLALVQMTALADRHPRALSGGQQQRVAIARALAVRPAILLLDEPFAALDRALRLDMQLEVKRIQRAAGITTILVTHDQEEALSMADQVAVLRQGRLEQFAPPDEVYQRPASLFVHSFVGVANLLPGHVVAQATVGLDCGADITAEGPAELTPGDRVVVCVRPEELGFADDGPIQGVLRATLKLGPGILHEVELADGTALKVAASRADAAPAPGASVRLALLSQAKPRAYPAP